ncbi:MAG: hypothetical protein RL596_2439, partial [Bacteroidota bacterium]
MKVRPVVSLLTVVAFTLGGISCKKTSSTSSTATTTTAVGTGVPDVYAKIYGATSITQDGTYIYIKVTGAPDHKSVYYASTNSLYEAFSGTTFGGNTFNKNPNTISVQNYTFKIPMNPTKAATSAAT